MNIFLWIAQALLLVAFIAAGATKVSTPAGKLATMMSWTTAVPNWSVKLLGLVEILGGLGMILPPLTHIAVILTPLAATGIAITMVGALLLHISRKEMSHIVSPLVLLVLAVVVAVGRFGPYAFHS